jgi:hypothetical protein
MSGTGPARTFGWASLLTLMRTTLFWPRRQKFMPRWRLMPSSRHISKYGTTSPGPNMTGSVLASTDTLKDWAMYSGEAVYEWFRRKTILLCSFRTIAADLETPAM